MPDSPPPTSKKYFPPKTKSGLRSWIFPAATVILYWAMKPTLFARITPMPPRTNHWWP